MTLRLVGIHNQRRNGMLCLERDKNQKIVVNGPCVITVIGHNTRLGIEAEPHVSILRAELLERSGDNEPTDIIRPDELEDGE
jgi:sRNA-binding carbon storage regulator CsrA